MECAASMLISLSLNLTFAPLNRSLALILTDLIGAYAAACMASRAQGGIGDNHRTQHHRQALRFKSGRSCTNWKKSEFDQKMSSITPVKWFAVKWFCGGTLCYAPLPAAAAAAACWIGAAL
jgi:hypothetical protein